VPQPNQYVVGFRASTQPTTLPEWNAERIKELFEQLEKQDNCHVFYQSFEVVELKTEAEKPGF
jgi:hypothetical protein